MGDIEMKKTSLLNIIWIWIEAVLLATLGILTIVYAKDVNAWNVIGYVTGVLILVDGLLRLGLYILTRSINISKVDLYRGIVEVTFGVFLLIRPEIVVSYFTLFIAIALVVIGVVCLIECVISNVHTNNLNKWALVTCYLLSILVLATGIVALIYYPYDLSKVGGNNTISILLIVIGILFILASIFIIIASLVNKKRQEKAAHIEGSKIEEERAKKREAKQKK